MTSIPATSFGYPQSKMRTCAEWMNTSVNCNCTEFCLHYGQALSDPSITVVLCIVHIIVFCFIHVGTSVHMKSPAYHQLAWYKSLFSYLLHGAGVFEQVTVAWLVEKFPAFESSLLCSEEPAIGSCLEPNESSPLHHILIICSSGNVLFCLCTVDVKILLCIHDSALSRMVDFLHNLFFFP